MPSSLRTACQKRRAAFSRSCEHSFDKVLPFDASAWRLRKPTGEHRILVEEAGAVAEMLGISEPRLRITYVAPAACMPVSGDPPTIVVGGNLHKITNPRERLFLFARALKVAANHLAPALRARPQDLDLALLALLQEHRGEPGKRGNDGPKCWTCGRGCSRPCPVARATRSIAWPWS